MITRGVFRFSIRALFLVSSVASVIFFLFAPGKEEPLTIEERIENSAVGLAMSLDGKSSIGRSKTIAALTKASCDKDLTESPRVVYFEVDKTQKSVEVWVVGQANLISEIVLKSRGEKQKYVLGPDEKDQLSERGFVDWHAIINISLLIDSVESVTLHCDVKSEKDGRASHRSR